MADFSTMLQSVSGSLPLIAIGIAFIVAAFFLIGMLKKVLENTVLGVAALLLFNFFGASFGLQLPLNLATVAVSIIFGLAGVGVMILLTILGVKI